MNSQFPAPVPAGASKNLQRFTVLAFVLIAVCFAYYVPVLREISTIRPDVLLFFRKTILPWWIGHTAVLLLLTSVLRTGARGALIFWGVSLAGLLAAGGLQPAIALVLLGVAAGLLMSSGAVIAKLLLPECSRGWAISLAMGILAVSVITSYLAWAHFLKWWILGPLLVSALILHRRTAVAVPVRQAFLRLCSGWNLSLALALQGLFLLLVFTYVYAVAPDMQSDALRFYWPYVRLMSVRGGFVDEPQMWSYIIPQAGLAYAAGIMTLFREGVLQLSSFLVWVTLLGIVCRRRGNAPLEVKAGLALLVGSCPVVLWVAPALMQDCFVCLTAIVLAVVCLEGERPGAPRFWVAVGTVAALGWAAKFSVAFYVLPLAAAALIRSWKHRGFVRTAAGAGLAGICGFFVLLPWLANSYRLSGNPVFPMLLNLFPAPLWPKGVGFSNLANFRLPPGPRGWFLWPVDLTYQTSRFVEGYDGRLGLTLILCLLLLLMVLWKGGMRARSIVICGVLGTAGVISMTAYARYWLTGFWLVALAAPSVLFLALNSGIRRLIFSASVFVVLLSHILMTAYGHWPSSRGWPWDLYSGKIAVDQYVERTHRALGSVRNLLGDREWPKIWFTSYEGVGYLHAQPIEAVLWELKLHVREPRQIVQYLASAGCKYWVVNLEGDDAQWIPKSGIAQFFWIPELLAAADGPVRVYRMRPPEEVMRDYDDRARTGSNLLADGGFEACAPNLPGNWLSDGDTGLLQDEMQAEAGIKCYRITGGGSLSQIVALPPAIRSLRLHVSLRGIKEIDQRLHWSILFRGFNSDPATSPVDTWAEDIELQSISGEFRIGNDWRRYEGNTIPVPPGSHYAVLYFAGGTQASAALLDSVSLEPRP